MITIAFVNSKGGVGKTTLTASMGVEAAKETFGTGKNERSANVSLVDLDPQRSLIRWHGGRGGDNPRLLDGVDDACDAIERLEYEGTADIVLIDSPPAFLGVIESCVTCADLVVLPLRASMLDLAATEDAYIMAKDAGTPTLMILNDVHPQEGVVSATREWLTEQNIALASTMIHHRVSHTYAMMASASAAERVNGKVDKQAQAELAALWAEIYAAAQRASKAKLEAAQ